MNIDEVRRFAYYQHDVVCNQKYNETLPYSFHLDLVEKQAIKFKYLLTDEEFDIVRMGAICHDLIEDARLTYNDIKNGVFSLTIYQLNQLADIIFACTELRGKDRDERHGPEFIQGLKDNKLGLFVKLCDISANVGFGLLTNSTMVARYRKEFPKFKEQLYLDEYKPLFDHIEKQLSL